MAKTLESVLAHVNQHRRGFLTALLVGSAVAAIPLMTTESMAAQGEDGCPEGQKKNKKGECVVPKKKAE